MGAIADPIRCFVDDNWPVELDEAKQMRESDGTVPNKLLGLADAIDFEHEHRMEQGRREARNAACRYLGGVLNDYKRGVRRSVRSKATKISHGTGEYGHVSCSSCGETVQKRDHYCWHCGSMLKDGKH